MKHKQCYTCGKRLPLSAFHKDKVTADGYRGQCKGCTERMRRRNGLDRIYQINKDSKAWYKEYVRLRKRWHKIDKKLSEDNE